MMLSFKRILLIALGIVLICTAAYAQSKKTPVERLDEIKVILKQSEAHSGSGREIQALKGYYMALGSLKKLKQDHPDFKPQEIDGMIRALTVNAEDLKKKVVKDGLIEYRGKSISFDEFQKVIDEERERQERWDRFQKWQEDDKRRRRQQRLQDDLSRDAEQKRFQDEMKRQQEEKRWRDERRRQRQQRQDAEERRRQYEMRQKRH
ncbi:hypothetical protein ACFLQ8_00255 [Candidatus Auribacterota bacterium]